MQLKGYAELAAGAAVSAIVAVFVALSAAGYIWAGCQ